MQKIQEVIKKGQNFLVMGHRNVDGDAYGSSMALYFYLQGLGKTVEVVNSLSITPLFYFLGVHDQVHKEIIGKNFDAIFVCDCGELTLVGKYLEQYPNIFRDTPIVNIDHHNGNKMFGTYNLVDTEASSTCELLYDLLELDKGIITSQIATLLLFGVIRDTNCFKNSLRPNTFAVTSKLLVRGAEYEKNIFHSYKSEKLNYLQLYGYVLENLISLK
jgi:phosphoesterase RecJ-like protein